MNQVYDKDKHIENLETVNATLSQRLTEILREKRRINDEQVLKWRNQAFYYKKKAKLMERVIEKFKSVGGKKEGGNGKIHSASAEEV